MVCSVPFSWPLHTTLLLPMGVCDRGATRKRGVCGKGDLAPGLFQKSRQRLLAPLCPPLVQGFSSEPGSVTLLPHVPQASFYGYRSPTPLSSLFLYIYFHTFFSTWVCHLLPALLIENPKREHSVHSFCTEHPAVPQSLTLKMKFLKML